MSSNFRHHLFVADPGNPAVTVPVLDDVVSSYRQETYPTASLDEICLEFDYQTDRNLYVDLRQTYLALKLKLGNGRGYQTYNTKEVKKE